MATGTVKCNEGLRVVALGIDLPLLAVAVDTIALHQRGRGPGRDGCGNGLRRSPTIGRSNGLFKAENRA